VNPDGLSFLAATNPEAVAAPVEVTCYVSDIASAANIASRFAGAAVDVVQTQRAPGAAAPQCEAIARGGSVRAARLAFTGTQIALGIDEKATRLAFQRMDRALTDAGIQAADIVMTHLYPLSARIGEMAKTIRAAPNPVSVIPFEGVAAIDGAFAVDAIAASR
jgi:enamine deaminase RidA (YjgF/YER057c/UK114 family)